MVSRRCAEALREPCEAWGHLSLHARQISKVRGLPAARDRAMLQHSITGSSGAHTGAGRLLPCDRAT